MEETVIGFVGCYSHDVILMLAKVLSSADKKVLLCDRNMRHTLGVSVPAPCGISVREDIIAYDGMYYTQRIISGEMLREYDVFLIDFGMQDIYGNIENCAEIFLVTDALPHHIRQLSGLELQKELVSQVLVRDVIHGVQSKEKELREFLQRFPNREETFLPPDKRDVKNRYVCESLHEYQIKNASPELQEFIYKTAKRLCPEISQREFLRKVRQQERRRYF